MYLIIHKSNLHVCPGGQRLFLKWSLEKTMANSEILNVAPGHFNCAAF